MKELLIIKTIGRVSIKKNRSKISYFGAAIWDPFFKLINITLAELTCWLVAHSAQYVQHKC